MHKSRTGAPLREMKTPLGDEEYEPAVFNGRAEAEFAARARLDTYVVFFDSDENGAPTDSRIFIIGRFTPWAAQRRTILRTFRRQGCKPLYGVLVRAIYRSEG